MNGVDVVQAITENDIYDNTNAKSAPQVLDSASISPKLSSEGSPGVGEQERPWKPSPGSI